MDKKKLMDEALRLMKGCYDKQQELRKTHDLFIVEGQGFVWIKKENVVG